MADDWSDEAFRLEVRRFVDRVLAGDVRDGATGLWNLGFTTGDFGFAGGMWQIWGRITDEFTHPDGDESEGRALAEEAARELRDALGDPGRERAFCDRWIYERLDIIL